jgi:hypothetical protein
MSYDVFDVARRSTQQLDEGVSTMKIKTKVRAGDGSSKHWT